MKKMLLLSIMCGMCLVACGREGISEHPSIHISDGTGAESETENQEIIEETEKDEAGKDETGKDEADKAEDQETAEEESLFENLKNMEFCLSSGAGGWRTLLHIKEDGSFTGEYSDSEMGSVGKGYPKGTYYYSSFKGNFTKPVKVNDYTYSVGIADGLEYKNEPGTSEIIDEVLYEYSTAFGMEKTNTLLFFLPGAPLEELPQEYLDWVRWDIEASKSDTLTFYGIYNTKEETGFSSYQMEAPKDEEISSTEERSNELKAMLEDDSLTQREMNEASKELYEVWDALLNKLWKEIKSTLPDKEYQSLLKEQREWIIEKEAAVDKAGAAVEGGSVKPLVENMKAAEITEKRVYELYEILKQ